MSGGKDEGRKIREGKSMELFKGNQREEREGKGGKWKECSEMGSE